MVEHERAEEQDGSLDAAALCVEPRMVFAAAASPRSRTVARHPTSWDVPAARLHPRRRARSAR